MKIEGRAKINLALSVEGLLENGYHRVKMIMQEIALCDEISLEFGKSGVNLSCNVSQIPTDSRNIAYRAAELFYAVTGIDDGVNIHIEKVIPSEAGLGGGSADGAAVLKGMNEHYGNPIPYGELISLGAKIGADVSFCIMGGTALAEGIGEVLTPIDSKVKADILIVKPDVGISTPWAYKRLDEVGCTPCDVDSVVSALEKGDTKELCRSMANTFEIVVPEVAPEIDAIKSKLIGYGALGAMMSGSGTAVFGIFDDADTLERACEDFRDNYPYVFKSKML
ncbi:MAG: 4-(cytidine 5'-diphospho)-2-C-methyl-D-erythritol kinase [Clostridia bacterium]|nr:4-(cytidine 5'-diphospho)-2-C-methyl-D-erythritol kinase [Clostridia bacterium]